MVMMSEKRDWLDDDDKRRIEMEKRLDKNYSDILEEKRILKELKENLDAAKKGLDNGSRD